MERGKTALPLERYSGPGPHPTAAPDARFLTPHLTIDVLLYNRRVLQSHSRHTGSSALGTRRLISKVTGVAPLPRSPRLLYGGAGAGCQVPGAPPNKTKPAIGYRAASSCVTAGGRTWCACEWSWSVHSWSVQSLRLAGGLGSSPRMKATISAEVRLVRGRVVVRGRVRVRVRVRVGGRCACPRQGSHV